jgi:hypothetical protein
VLEHWDSIHSSQWIQIEETTRWVE